MISDKHSIMQHFLWAFITLPILLFPAEKSSGQIPKEYTPLYSNPFSESWRWQSYPELIGRGCRCMVEGIDGTLWFGVSDGVMCYDGLEWDYYPFPEDSLNVPVLSLCFDEDGALYAGTSDGICRFADSKWEKLNFNVEFGDPGEYVFNKVPIIKSTDGSVWIGSKYGAIRVKDGSSTLYRPYSVITEISGENNSFYKSEIFDVYNIFERSPGELWFGLRDGRIYTADLNDHTGNNNLNWKRIDNSNNYIPVKYPLIKQNGKGNIYIASAQYGGGVNISNGSTWKHVKLGGQFRIDEIYSDIIRLHDGRICIAGLGRIFIEEGNVWQMYESPAFPFSSNRLLLYQTNDNNLWILGLANEAWKIDLSNKNWATLLGLNFQDEDSRGNYWYISFDGKVVKYNLSTNTWSQFGESSDLIDSPVRLLITQSGRIWVAGSDNQVAATAYFNGVKWIKQHHPNLGWGIDRRAVFEAADGSLWFGSSANFIVEKGQLGGLVRYRNIDYDEPGKISYEYHHPDEDFQLGPIYGIGQTPDGIIWAGQMGFYGYDSNLDKWQKITNPKGLDGSFVDCIDTAPNGDLWVGTRTNGLYWLNSSDGQWHNFTTENGLSSNTIVNIYAENINSIWAATDKNISHFDGNNWFDRIFSGNFKSIRDGIAIRGTSDGSLWINQNPPIWHRRVLNKGKLSRELFNQFKAVKYLPDSLAPETKITFSQEEISQPGNVILSWIGQDPWKSSSGSDIQYSYRMDNNEWQPYTNRTSDIFLALEEGSHTFEVRARDRDFNVDKTPATVSFYVIPPVWKEAWFILLILSFLSIIAIFMIFLYHRNKVIRDISETKVRLFANISHELRTPLVLILGPLSKIIDSNLLDERLSKPFNTVNRNTQRLLRLVNQVLDFRKIEAGQLKFEPGQADIISFLKEEVLVFDEAAESKNIQLQCNTELEKLRMWFDLDKMEKVMYNILSNAVKYTPENGWIDVNISITNSTSSKTINIEKHNKIRFDKWLNISVSDSGIGIPTKELGKIFSRFYQVKGRSKTAVGGTGIGLALVKDLINIHYGKVSVESSVGRGSTFRVQIPLIDEETLGGVIQNEVVRQSEYVKFKYPEKEKRKLDGAEDQKKVISKEQSKILVVEDNLDMREYITQELGNIYNVIEAKNGMEGFNQAVSENPDLILSDVMMPQMDGIEFCEKIKTDERTSHIPVVLLTARSSHEHKIEGLETGADDYLTKPFFVDELLLKINNIIESRKKFRERFGKIIDVEPSDIQITSRDKKFIDEAIRIVEENIDDLDFDVEKFSRLIGVSRVGLYNKIKALTNHSVKEFIFVIKLKRAAKLLAESGMSVTEITYEVGFKSPSHFAKLFKKQFGISPKAFQNENMEKE